MIQLVQNNLVLWCLLRTFTPFQKEKEKQCPLDVYCMQKSDVVVEIA